MQVSKWGNSLAVRLPKKLVDSLKLSEGDELAVVDVVGRTLVVAKAERRIAALKKMSGRGWVLPKDYKFDRDEVNKR